jgi:putative nucleotidyltransferase with HDIG domain
VAPALDDPHSFFDGHFVLPPLPAVVTRLIETLDGGRANAAEVADVLSADAGLVAQLLKIVNSAYYGLPTPIKDVKHAVAYLGLAEIKRVALTVGVMERLRPENADEFQRFWYHSFHTALAAKFIAKKTSMVVDIEEIHVAALLHDVGKLVYLKFFPDQFERLSDYRAKQSTMIVDAEVHLGLPSHTELGATLCDRWMLPRSVKRACQSHELGDLHRMLADGDDREELKVICVANLLSNLCTEELTEELKTTIQDTASRALEFDEDRFLLLMGELYELRAELQQFLQELRAA